MPPGGREDGRLEVDRERCRERRSPTACGNSLAMVGTTALFLDNMKPAEQCKDKTGKPTGIPDIATLQTYAAEQCSPVSFAALPGAGSCPYTGSGVRTFQGVVDPDRLLLQEVRRGTHCTACSSFPMTCPRRSRRRHRCSRPTSSSGSRRTPSSASARSRTQSDYTSVRAGDQDAQLDVRPQRRRLREQRVLAQGSAGAGRQHA